MGKQNPTDQQTTCPLRTSKTTHCAGCSSAMHNHCFPVHACHCTTHCAGCIFSHAQSLFSCSRLPLYHPLCRMLFSHAQSLFSCSRLPLYHKAIAVSIRQMTATAASVACWAALLQRTKDWEKVLRCPLSYTHGHTYQKAKDVRVLNDQINDFRKFFFLFYKQLYQ